MFLGITMFCARLRVILALSVRRRLWLWEGPKNTIMLQNINFFTIIYTYRGYWENKTEKWEKSQKEGEGIPNGVGQWYSGHPRPLLAPYKHSGRSGHCGVKASLLRRALQDIAKKGYTSESPRRKNCADGSIQGYSGEVCWIIWRPKSP